jgi:serine/threonine-protein kinase PknG
MATALPMPLTPADEPYTVTETQNEDPTLLIDTLTQSGPHSVAARLRIVSAWIELGDFAAAFGDLEVARNLAADHHDWRLQWYYGLIELAMRRQERARVAFDGVCDMLPGELAPKIALAFCAECQQDYPTASRLYECAWRIDRYSVAAAFGFVRTLLARNALRAAVEVLDSIPHDSPYYVDSQVAAIRIMVSASDTAKVTEKDLVNAARRLDALKLESSQYLELSVQILESALSWIMEGEPGETQESGPASVLNCQLMERDLRRGLERCYRGLAATASTPQLRHALVDQANAIRPVTIM